MSIKVVTLRNLEGENPLFPSSKFSAEFVLLNMHPDGVWLVDKQFPDFLKVVDVADKIARTYGDSETLKKLEGIKAEIKLLKKEVSDE